MSEITADRETLERVIDDMFEALGVTDNEAALVEIDRLKGLSHPAPSPSQSTALLETIWQEILDKDDRNSPEEYPEMVMLTQDELHDYMKRWAAAAPPPQTAAIAAEPVSIDLMQRVWFNLYFDEEEAGNTFQHTLNEVVDWLAAHNALPDEAAPTTSPEPDHRVYVCYDGFGAHYVSRDPKQHVAICYDEDFADRIVEMCERRSPEPDAVRDLVYEVALAELEKKRLMPTSVTLATAIANAYSAALSAPVAGEAALQNTTQEKT